MREPEKKAGARSWRDSVISSLKWSAVGRLSAQAITWAATLVVIRLLSPSDYGLMASAMIVVGLALTLRDLGVVPSVIRSQDITEHDLRSCKTSVYLVSTCMAALVFLISFPIVAWTDQPELRAILQVFSIAFLLTPIGTVEYALLRKDMQFKKLSIIELCTAALSSIILLVLAFAGAGVWSLVIGVFINHVGHSFGYRLAYDRKIGFSWDLRPAMAHMRFGIPASLQQLVFALTSAVTNFLIGHFHGVVALGLYAVARDLSRLPVNKAMPVVNSVMMPAFSAVQDDPVRIRNSFLTGAGALSAFFVATLWGFAGTADAVVPLVLGPQWLPATPLIQIVSLWVPISALLHLFPSIAIAMGHPKQALVQNIYNLLMIVLALGMSASTGIEGAVVALGVANIIAVLEVAWRTTRMLRCSYFLFFKPLVIPVVAGTAMLAALWGFKEYGIQPHDGLWNLLIRIAGGALIYCGVFLLLGRDQVAAYRKILFKR